MWVTLCERTSASFTLGLYFIVQVPRPRWMSMSWPNVSCESRRKWRRTAGCDSSGQRGRGRAAQRRRNRREAVADCGGDARLGRGHVEAALARARLLVQEGLVPGGLVEGTEVRRGLHARSYAMAAASASASRSMSAWVCTSVTQTSADWPSAVECAREVERAVDACRGERAVDLGDGPAGAVEVDRRTP